MNADARPLSADTQGRTATSEELLARMVELCHGNRGTNVVSLDVRELVQYTDFLLVVTGRSARQNRSTASQVRQAMKRELRQLPLSVSGTDHGAWICMDYVDVVLHIFDDECRSHYDLELLWADAKRVEHEPIRREGALSEDADYAEAEDVNEEDRPSDWAPVIRPPSRTKDVSDT